MNQPERPPDILRGADEIGDYLRVKRWTLTRWRDEGLPVTYQGGLMAIRSDLDDWIRSRRKRREPRPK